MSENNGRKLENIEETVEVKEKPARRPKKKKRRKGRVSVRLAALLVVVSMAFGIIVGYAVGRATATARLSAAEQRINELTDATEEAGRTEIDVFTDSISAENRAALADLSGMSMQSSEENVFLGEEGEDVFTGISESVLADPVVVAEFNGGSIMSDEVSSEYNQRLTGYIFSGYTEEEIAAKLLDEVMQDMVAERVLKAQAEKLGLLTLTAADTQQIAAQAQAEYDAETELYKSFVYVDGMTDLEVVAAAQAFLEESGGVNLESIRAGIEQDWWQQKLKNEVVKDVQVGSTEILAAYNARLDEQKESFTADPAEFEAAQKRGDVILYNLSGYRAVKPLFIRMSDGLAGEAAELQGALELLGSDGDAAQAAEIQARLDECDASVEAQAQDVLSRLSAGESFDSLLAQYGDGTGVCYVKAGSASLPAEVVSVAMEMTAPGQLSAIIRVENGVCILQYVGEVQGGAVDMAAVYDAITAEALAEAQDIAYEAQVTAWLEEAAPKYYPELMS